MVKEKKIHIHLSRELILGLVLLLAVAALALGLTADSYADKFLPSTTVNGVKVTAMDAEDAADALVKAAARVAGFVVSRVDAVPEYSAADLL